MKTVTNPVDLTNCPVIFPRLTADLVNQGQLIISGKRRSDVKLLALLCTKDKLPHLMYFSKGVWNTVDHSAIDLILFDSVIPYEYSRLIDAPIGETLSFLRVCGSISFEIGQLNDTRGKRIRSWSASLG